MSLKSKLVTFILGIVITCGVLIIGSVLFNLRLEMNSLTVRQQDQSIRTAALAFKNEFPNFQFQLNNNNVIARLSMDALPEFENHDLIESVAMATGETATVFAWDEAQKDFVRATTNIKKSDGSRAVGTYLGKNGAVYPVIMRGETFRGEANILGIDYFTIYSPIFDASNKIIGILYVGVQKEASEVLFWNIGSTALVTTLIIIFVLAGISSVIAQKGVAPLQALTDRMLTLSEGDTTSPVLGDRRKDELGDIARALIVFKDAEDERRKLEEEQKAISAQQLNRAQKIEALAQEFETVIASRLQEIDAEANQLDGNAQTMQGNANQTLTQVSSVSSALGETSTNMQTVSAATEEMTSSIAEIARQMSESNTIVTGAVEQADASNAEINQLAETAQRVGEIISIINDVANQTNLLALNATIEAARAGEAGKGFAVVANEVKSLASQTSTATGQIEDQIQQMQSATNAAVAATRQITRTIQSVEEISNNISTAVQQQSAATSEIAQNVGAASRATYEVTDSVQKVSEASEETSESSATVLSSSANLSRQSKQIQESITEFLNQIKTA